MAVKIKRGMRKHSLHNVFDDFIEYCKEKGLAQASIQTYSEQAILFNKYAGNIDVEDLTEEFVYDFRYWLKENRHFNEVSTNTVYRTINIYLTFMHEEYGIELFHLDYLKTVKKIKNIFSDEDIKKLTRKPNINDCNYSELRDFICVLISLNTGARASSVINIKRDDINIKEKTITFRHSKNGKQFVMPVPKYVMDNIKWYLDVVEFPNEYLFLNSLNQQLTSKQLSVSFRRYCLNRKVKITSYHAMRHWYATRLMKETGNIFLVSKALQHQNISTTERYLSTLGINSYAKQLEDIDLTRGLKG